MTGYTRTSGRIAVLCAAVLGFSTNAFAFSSLVLTWAYSVGVQTQAAHFYEVGSNAGYDGTKMGFYGNWCGSGGTGPTQDAYDVCCQAHDNCYGAKSCSVFSTSPVTEPCKQCDRDAAACWLSARAKDPARYGSGSTFLYPCYRCTTTGKTGPLTSAGQEECNRICKAGLFP